MITEESFPLVSVIIPVWKDDQALIDLVSKLTANQRVEWIVAAVNPSDRLRRAAENFGAVVVECPTPSRGQQMNAGAAVARGSLLCFHHADTFLDCRHLKALMMASANAEVAGGAFYRQLDNRHQWALPFNRVVRWWDRHFGLLMGDQSIFVRTQVYSDMNGYANIPLMEDVEFSRRFRKRHRVTMLDPALASSDRRSRRLGSWKTTGINLVFLTLFRLGVSPERLHRWYYTVK